MESFWTSVAETTLRQGDLLPKCKIPKFPTDFALANGQELIVHTKQADLIVITQSCDLEHGDPELVSLCPIWSISKFEAAQSEHGRTRSTKAWRDYWNNVRKGRSPTLHLLASPDQPSIARESRVVDFRAIYSLPTAYLMLQTQEIGNRWRLQSPFLEHFSQAFARSFMRVGLPSAVPEF